MFLGLIYDLQKTFSETIQFSYTMGNFSPEKNRVKYRGEMKTTQRNITITDEGTKNSMEHKVLPTFIESFFNTTGILLLEKTRKVMEKCACYTVSTMVYI